MGYGEKTPVPLNAKQTIDTENSNNIKAKSIKLYLMLVSVIILTGCATSIPSSTDKNFRILVLAHTRDNFDILRV